MENKTGLKPEVAVNHTCSLGEGPVWDTKRKLIYWVDIIKGYIHQFSPASQVHRIIPVHQMIGSVAVCKNGDLIGAFQYGFGFIDPESGEIKMLTDPEEHLPGNRFNDGKCDPAGRFWAGTMPLSEDSPAGSLYMLANDLSVTKQIGGITISNGLAWSLDHKTLYYIDTPTYQVAAYEFDKSTGNISNKKKIIQIPKEDGYPDGMTIDNEGMLWIAHWNGWQITRWDPATGKKIYQIALPVAKVTSCTFGGDTLEDLYITTASIDLTKDDLQKQRLAGSLFVVRNCGFKGIEAFEFDTKKTNER
jgi:sugar lactone lactonase YvrE